MKDITTALVDWASGDASALDRIAPEVYPILRELAGAFFRRERPRHTWQATALWGELFLKLASQCAHRDESRLHACARLVRLAVIDHARTARADKRGGELVNVPLHPDLAWFDAASPAMLDLDRALTGLAKMARTRLYRRLTAVAG